jgi:transcriptional regulator with PAS, ATPase and Fis domain
MFNGEYLMHEWLKEFPGAVTVCDRDGIIIEMNERSIRSFEKDGGSALIGKNVLDCHPEPARTELKEMLASGKTNVYTIEKNGQKKLIYQAPWFSDGEYRGFVELSLEIPNTMPHHIRG